MEVVEEREEAVHVGVAAVETTIETGTCTLGSPQHVAQHPLALHPPRHNNVHAVLDLGLEGSESAGRGGGDDVGDLGVALGQVGLEIHLLPAVELALLYARKTQGLQGGHL